MNPYVAGAIGGTAQSVAGGVVDQIFGKRNDRRAIKQHQAFTEINSQANKDLAVFGHELQKEMYDYTTDIKGIAEKYEAAGLNPIAMMGGTSGAMGQSVSAGGGSSKAESGNVQSPEMMAMAMQLKQAKIQEKMAEDISN